MGLVKENTSTWLCMPKGGDRFGTVIQSALVEGFPHELNNGCPYPTRTYGQATASLLPLLVSIRKTIQLANRSTSSIMKRARHQRENDPTQSNKGERNRALLTNVCDGNTATRVNEMFSQTALLPMVITIGRHYSSCDV